MLRYSYNENTYYMSLEDSTYSEGCSAGTDVVYNSSLRSLSKLRGDLEYQESLKKRENFLDTQNSNALTKKMK